MLLGVGGTWKLAKRSGLNWSRASKGAEAYRNSYGKSLELALVTLPGTRAAMTGHDRADATHARRRD
jgi:hypothetical protein